MLASYKPGSTYSSTSKPIIPGSVIIVHVNSRWKREREKKKEVLVWRDCKLKKCLEISWMSKNDKNMKASSI